MAHELFTFRPTNAKRGVIAIRPDGVVFLGASDLAAAGIGDNSPYIPKAFFHLLPAYSQVSPDLCLPELNGLPTMKGGGLTLTRPVELQAITVIPGASVQRDWGYSPQPEAPPSSADGCGCGTSRAPTWLALLATTLLALGMRARPRSS